MLSRLRSLQRGDTLIEVMIATAILSMTIVTAMSIMQRGFSVVLDSSQRTQVQALINGQANILRSARDSSITKPQANLWQYVVAQTTSASPVVADGCTPKVQRFFFPQNASDPDWTKIQSGSSAQLSPPPGEVIPAPGYGIWIEGYKYANNGTTYYDFYIKACWSSNAGSGPSNQLKTVVRLYEPN